MDCSLDNKTANLLESLPRATRCLAVQLRSGHFPITKSYRYRFRLTDNPKCDTFCLDDTITHRIFICRRHIKTRLTLRKKIIAMGIRFELGPMLRNAKTLQALYDKKYRWAQFLFCIALAIYILFIHFLFPDVPILFSSLVYFYLFVRLRHILMLCQLLKTTVHM